MGLQVLRLLCIDAKHGIRGSNRLGWGSAGRFFFVSIDFSAFGSNASTSMGIWHMHTKSLGVEI